MRWWTRRSQDDFSAEIEAHLAIETERLVAEGLAPKEAAAAARRAFGNVTAATERFHERGRALWLDDLRRDLRTGAHSLARSPVAATVAILSLAAGIGATTAALTVRDVIFQNPPPLYDDPAQLSKVQMSRQRRPVFPVGSFIPGDLFATWTTAGTLPLAAATPSRGPRDVRAAVGDMAGETVRVEPVPVRAVTANLFGLLGVEPHAGRSLAAPGARSGGPEAVLSYRLWQQWFAGRAEAMGRTVWIEEEAHTVVGVLPERFWFSDMSAPIWTLLDPRTLTANDEVHVVARRPRGTSEAAVAAALAPSVADYERRLPAAERPLRLVASAIKGTPMGDQMSLLLPYVLGACVLLTLLIACANAAVLMIAQWTTRESETAVRVALGASRGRIVRALIAESTVLATVAGLLGVAATFVLHGIMVSQDGDGFVFLDLSIHPMVLIQTAVVTLATGILAGLGPALFETRRLHTDPLRGIATSDRVRQRWSQALVVFEITVTVALLVVTSSMVAGYQRARTAEFGFDPAPLLLGVLLHPDGIPAATLLNEIAGLPGVTGAAASTAAPLSGRGAVEPVAIDSAGARTVQAERMAISPGFFSTLGVPMRAGRAFTKADTALTRRVIVNEALMRQRGQAASLGERVWIGGIVHEVVGIVADYSNRPFESRAITPQIYLPLTSDPRATTMLRFVARAVDPGPLVQPLRRTLQGVSPSARVTSVIPMRQLLEIIQQEMLVGTAPLFPLIVIGMLLTSSGIYGVLAFSVARRTRELAVRVAIGASRREQLRLVIAHSARLLGLGTALGMGLTFGLSRILRAAGGAGSIYDPDWVAFVLPVLLVFVVGAVATWIPTRRALAISPSLLLRTN